jgi:SAM-dependent methyltransferase
VTSLEAVRTAYDTVAADYHALVHPMLTGKPFDRAMIAVFAELVTGPVLDIGCGPGYKTAHLRDLGLDAFGIDLSPEMIAVARREYPGLRYEVGSMLELDVADASVGGVMASYSIIHLPPEKLPVALAEFHRVLAPGGHVLVAFQVGDEVRHLTEGYGHQISLDAHRLPPDRIAAEMEQAGLAMVSRLVREPEEGEKTPQAVLIARKPVSDPR